MRSSTRLRDVDALRASEERLTPREMEVLELISEGSSNQEIGEILGIERETAKSHVANLLPKLGARTRAEAVANAFRKGLIT